MTAVYVSFCKYFHGDNKLLTIFRCFIVYIKYTFRRNDLMNIDVVDLNSPK